MLSSKISSTRILETVIVLFGCGIPWPLAAQEAAVTDIRIHGCKAISEKKILDAITLKTGHAFVEPVWASDLRRILDLYAKKGLLSTVIDSASTVFSPDRSGVELHVYITESDPPQIDSIGFRGNRVFDEAQLYESIRIRSGQIFDVAAIEADINALLDLYERNGYAFAEIRLTDLKSSKADDRQGVGFVLQIDEGPPVRLTDWRISGNSTVKPYVITREFRQPLPSLFNRDRVDAGLARIGRLPFIYDASLGSLYKKSDTSWTAQIDIVEGPSNAIDGVFGYVPAQGNANGYFAGFVNLKFTNLFGTARRLGVQWQKRDRYTAFFALSYTEPWFAGIPLWATLSGEWLVQDTTFVDQAVVVSAEYDIDAEWTVTGGVAARFITTADNVIAYQSGTADATIGSGLMGLMYDTRDNATNPRRGILYKAGLEYNRRREKRFVDDVAGPDSVSLPGGVVRGFLRSTILHTQHVSMDLETNFPVHGQIVLSNAAHAALYRSPDGIPDASELIAIGGLKTLRGYPEEFFDGSRVLWNNLELRWLTGRQSRIFVFLDAGNYYKKVRGVTSLETVKGRPLGYGFGMRYETRAGIMALDFGLGRNDSFSQAKVHFGLAAQF